jgi:G3E family GTPase
VVELRNTVCVVDPQQLSAAPYLQNTIYREQIAAADVIVLGRRDTTASERATARVTLERLGAPFVVDADDSLAAAVFDAK